MHDVLTPSPNCSLSKPSPIFPCRASSSVDKGSFALQRKRCAASTAFESNARAQSATRSESIDRFAKFIDEASDRFAVPARWIRAVMQVESGGDERAISSRGAMGLMQLMLATWVELSGRHGLGLDPFDPRDNILAGSAYLKVMYDRFGSLGFLAAYHAGPSRYEQHLATGQSLPPATAAYVAAVAPLRGDGQGERPHFAPGAQFLGGKRRCLLNARMRDE